MQFRKSLTAGLAGVLLGLPALPKSSKVDEFSYGRKLDSDRAILQALNRLTFGPRPGDAEQVKRLGLKKWIDQQLHPERLRPEPELEQRLAKLDSLQLNNQELAQKYPSPQSIMAFASGRAPLPDDPQQRENIQRLAEKYKARLEKKGIDPQALAKGAAAAPATTRPGNRREALMAAAPQRLLAQDLQEAKLYRAVYGNQQLQEVLTDFWFNHFNVFLDKGADRYLITSYERDAIRPNVLRHFSDLLRATAENPAMLFYLDNWQSVAANLPARRPNAKARGLNENYARELLELHTLGVDGGYTQKDIIEIARCFTGWTIRQPYVGAEFVFNERVHDKGEKTVLGVKIPAGGGQEDGFKVLDIVAHHPSTARFISRKLAQRFVSDNPPDKLVSAMANTFRKSDGDIREVMKTMLSSKEFWSEGAYRAKVKSPFEMVASALRVTGADVNSAMSVANKISELGQPLYRKQEPTGYSAKNAEWINSGALLARMNFALALMKNELPGVTVDSSQFSSKLEEMAQRVLSVPASEQTQQAITRAITDKAEPRILAALLLGSPEFQHR